MQESPIKAIVFDSNVFGQSVQPNVDTIQSWADACGRHDAELWLPEPVALELAERVIAACDDFRSAATSHNEARRKWGLPPVSVPQSVSHLDVVDALETAGAVVLPVEDEVAAEALRDQILVQGMASRKKGVKTGASDAAWIRTVLDYAGGSGDGLIVVTNDARARDYLLNQAAGDMRVVQNLGQIRQLLDETTVASSEQQMAFLAALSDHQDGRPTARLQELAELSQWNWWASPFDYGYEWELQERQFEVSDDPSPLSEVEYDAWTNSLTGRVHFDVLVEESYARQDQSGDGLNISTETYAAWIEGNVAVSFTSEGLGRWHEFEEVKLGTYG